MQAAVSSDTMTPTHHRNAGSHATRRDVMMYTQSDGTCFLINCLLVEDIRYFVEYDRVDTYPLY